MFIENFIGEAKLVSDLIHTNIVQTYHLGEARGIYFIAMELIRGVNLEQFTNSSRTNSGSCPRVGCFHYAVESPRPRLRAHQSR
jgi:serine/threonine-protein kinase